NVPQLKARLASPALFPHPAREDPSYRRFALRAGGVMVGYGLSTISESDCPDNSTSLKETKNAPFVFSRYEHGCGGTGRALDPYPVELRSECRAGSRGSELPRTGELVFALPEPRGNDAGGKRSIGVADEAGGGQRFGRPYWRKPAELD